MIYPNPSATLFIKRCDFWQRNRIWSETSNLSSSDQQFRDASGSAALRSNFLINAASSNNIYTIASQTLVHGSMTVHDELSLVPREMRKRRTMQRVLVLLNVFSLKDSPLFWDHVVPSIVFSKYPRPFFLKNNLVQGLQNVPLIRNEDSPCSIMPPLSSWL